MKGAGKFQFARFLSRRQKLIYARFPREGLAAFRAMIIIISIMVGYAATLSSDVFEIVNQQVYPNQVANVVVSLIMIIGTMVAIFAIIPIIITFFIKCIWYVIQSFLKLKERHRAGEPFKFSDFVMPVLAVFIMINIVIALSVKSAFFEDTLYGQVMALFGGGMLVVIMYSGLAIAVWFYHWVIYALLWLGFIGLELLGVELDDKRQPIYYSMFGVFAFLVGAGPNHSFNSVHVFMVCAALGIFAGVLYWALRNLVFPQSAIARP